MAQSHWKSKWNSWNLHSGLSFSRAQSINLTATQWDNFSDPNHGFPFELPSIIYKEKATSHKCGNGATNGEVKLAMVDYIVWSRMEYQNHS